MGKYSAKGGGDFKPVSSGLHPAVCTLIADVGVQPQTNPAFAPNRKIVFRFEIGDEDVEYTDKDGKAVKAPAIVYDTLTGSMNRKANMRAMLEGWRGQAFTDEEAENFDTKEVLGAYCMLNIVHKESNGKTFANISSISRLPKGYPKKEPKAKPVYFHIDEDRRQEAELPKWIAEKVAQAITERAPSREQADDRMAGEFGGRDDPDDDIPF